MTTLSLFNTLSGHPLSGCRFVVLYSNKESVLAGLGIRLESSHPSTADLSFFQNEAAFANQHLFMVGFMTADQVKL